MSSWRLATSDACFTVLNDLREHITKHAATTIHEPEIPPSSRSDSEVMYLHANLPLKRKRMLDLPAPENSPTFNDVDHTDGGYYSADYRSNNSFKSQKTDAQTETKAATYESYEPSADRRTAKDLKKAKDTSYDGALHALFLELCNSLGRLVTREERENKFPVVHHADDTNDTEDIDIDDIAGTDDLEIDDIDDTDNTDDTYYGLGPSNDLYKKRIQALKYSIDRCEDSAADWLKGTGNPSFLEEIEDELKSYVLWGGIAL